MKKTNFFIMLFAAFSLMLISCDDKDTTNGEYVLSDEEQKELDRQDSLLNAQKNQINADLVLEYDCKIVISSNRYTGTMLDIELDKIAGLFDITTEQLLAGIAGEDASAPEVKGFAIEWSTRKDYGEASNTNAPWGHWWDANGDVTTWGETAMVFAEFDYETGKFHVGQYPAHLVVGQTINFIECLKYNDKRVAVVVKVLAGEAEEVVASVVDTQELEVTTIPNNTFEQTPVQFNLAKVLSDLGISSMISE